MANKEHLAILKQGVDAWHRWRKENPDIQPDLRGAELYGANLSGWNLSRANLSGAMLHRANLANADLSYSDLSHAALYEANLSAYDPPPCNLSHANLTEARLGDAFLWRADLSDAVLRRADLAGANLRDAVLRAADLREADLEGAVLVRANLEGADLTGCRVYGVSAWDLKLQAANQSNLVVTAKYSDEPMITVDHLEVAQFVHLLLYKEKIRHVIDTVTAKAVLILGRFTPDERKKVLDAIRDELRKRDYLPVIFDFEKPTSRNLTETVTLLARMSRFIIADLTDPRSIPHELYAIVPTLSSVPVQPILLSSQTEYAMFDDLAVYQWVLPILKYDQVDDLLRFLPEKVIAPAEQKASELAKR